MRAPDERDSMVVVWLALALCAGMCLAGAVTGCGAGTPTAQQQAEVSGYGGAEAICVQSAATKAQADECRDRVKTLFCGDGGILADSGGCDHMVLSDGGRP